jgi:hypothetical protein
MRRVDGDTGSWMGRIRFMALGDAERSRDGAAGAAAFWSTCRS